MDARPRAEPARPAHRRHRRDDEGRVGVAAKALGSLSRPERALEDAKVAVEGLGEIVWAAANPAPPSPLNVEIGPHRRFAGVACELADFKAVKNAFGGTVNDVVLDRRRGRAAPLAALARRAHAGPRAARARPGLGAPSRPRSNGTGNRLAVMRGPLPVYVEDPVERLAVVRAAMDDLKESKQAVGAEVLTSMQQLRAADDPRPGLAAELLHAPLQPARHERARARSSRSTSRAAR